MKNCPLIVKTGIFLVIIFFFSANHSSRAGEYVVLQPGPPPEIIAADGKAKLLYGEFIRRQLKKKYPDLEKIVVGDKRYMFITDKWFRDVMDWTDTFIKIQVPQLDSLDSLPLAYEETFSMLMSNFANMAVAKRYNVKGSVLIGLLVAESHNPWGVIPADGSHRRYIVGLTTNGLLVYDIPTRQFIAGEDFPNKEYMTGIIF